jgi:hypothetical protein
MEVLPQPSRDPGELERKLPSLARLLANKYYVDEMYDAWIVQPYWKLCAALDAFDRKFVDGLVNAAGALTEVLAQVLKLFQTGQVRRYALWFMLGAIAILWLSRMSIAIARRTRPAGPHADRGPGRRTRAHDGRALPQIERRVGARRLRRHRLRDLPGPSRCFQDNIKVSPPLRRADRRPLRSHLLPLFW